MGISVESTEWLFSPLFPGRIGIWKCWFLWREENRSIRRKTLGARTRTNNKLNPHRDRESNPGHIGGRRVLSPLRHPCSHIILFYLFYFIIILLFYFIDLFILFYFIFYSFIIY